MKIILSIVISILLFIGTLFPQNNTPKVNQLIKQETIYIFYDSSIAKSVDQKNEKSPFELWLPVLVVIIGGFIALYQVRINIIKTAIISWIENLRQNISQFISSTDNIRHILDIMANEVSKGTTPDNAFSNYEKELISAFASSTLFVTKIRLYLNLQDAEHVELNDKISNYIKISQDRFNKINKAKIDEMIQNTTNDIIKISYTILNKEWDKVSKVWWK